MKYPHYLSVLRFASAVFIALTLIIAPGCDSLDLDDSDEDEEYIADLSQVPEVILDAAYKAVPGLKIRRVEREETSRGRIYEVYGTANGIFYEIEIGSDGTVYEIEREDDDD